ncbi:MAG: hypothetical protein ACR2LN_05900 [Candidatus Levyibacteriota bacterium]
MNRNKLFFPLFGIIVALLLYVFASMYPTNQHQGGGGSADNSANASGGTSSPNNTQGTSQNNATQNSTTQMTPSSFPGMP